MNLHAIDDFISEQFNKFKCCRVVMLQLTKQLYDEVLDALGENGTLSCELDVTAESADNSHVYVFSNCCLYAPCVICVIIPFWRPPP